MIKLYSKRQRDVLIGGFIFISSAFFFTPGNLYASVRVYFSPKGGCEQAILDVLGGAKKTVFVQASSFSLYPLIQGMMDAEKRGVNVEMILDKRQIESIGAGLGFILKAGGVIYLDSSHTIAHNNLMVIDKETVITGSYNFTTIAEDSNAENLLILQDKTLAAEYAANWNKHKAHSIKFE